VIEGGVVSFVRSDHIGRPVFATNAAGTKVWTASYLPFGGVRTTTGTPLTARFPGQWFQSESGLHQNWMRDYDPTTGRYQEADPLGLIAGASLYGYANQSPMMYVDPRGENPAAVCAIPSVAPLCGKVIQMCIEGVVIGGIVAYDYLMSPSELEEACQDCANNNYPPPPPEDCPVRYSRLKTWYEILVISMGEGTSIGRSTLTDYARQAKAYNAQCVPRGYQALPTNFLR
jgi:RHS repeat-associated protein